MLRECRRVLKRSGLIAGYVIHSPVNLTAADRQRIRELTPMDVLADGTPEDLFCQAGFSIITCDDVTAEYRSTAAAIIQAREGLEAELRAVDGSHTYEEDQARKRNALVGIDEGLLQRSLIAARRP